MIVVQQEMHATRQASCCSMKDKPVVTIDYFNVCDQAGLARLLGIRNNKFTARNMRLQGGTESLH